MVLVVGEILIDMFPDNERIGGAPFNFAYHLKKLGLPVRFLTRVGEDGPGRKILERLANSGFELSDVQVDAAHPTGTVQVSLDARGVPRFDIRRKVAYDFLQLDPDLAGSAQRCPSMIYYGSLVQRTETGRQQVETLLAGKHPQTIGFCDINLRPPHINGNALLSCLDHADILKLNEEELRRLQQEGQRPEDEKSSIRWLRKTCGIDTVALTRGEAGSSFFDATGRMDQPVGDPGCVVDTVGAGDAFAAILAAGHLRKLPRKATLRQAARFAASICTIAGAVPDSDDLYIPLRSWIKGNEDER